MSKGSLQDQLRQAGLANQKQLVKARKAKNQREKLARKGQLDDDDAAEAVHQADVQKREHDRALNAERQRQSDAKAVAAQIRQLIALNRITERGEVEFSYQHDNRIRTLRVSAQQRQSLIDGRLALVGQRETTDIVAAPVARKIAERDEDWIILMNVADDSSEIPDGEDPYAEYQIPDDLMW